MEFYGSIHNHTDRSNFRLRDSTNRLDELCWYAAKDLGHNFIAITDHETIATAIDCQKVEKKIREEYPEFKIIRGNEIYLCRNGLSKENYKIVTLERLFQMYYGKSLHTSLWTIREPEERLKFLVENVEGITKLKEFGNYMNKILTIDMLFLNEDREMSNQYFLFNLMKQNRIINYNKKREKEINILSEFISKYKNKKLNTNDSNLYENNEMIIQTNISTDDSISNDSLLLDSEEQIDIEFTSKDFFSEQNNIELKNNGKNKNLIVPPLDLRLINFNKQNDLSYKEKSLSRKIMFELSDDKVQDEKTIEENIEKLKRQIKYFKRKNKILENKCKKYENKISKFSLILYSK